MSNSARRTLYRERQAQFMRDLFAQKSERNLLTESILHKRSAILAERWPSLRRQLGDRWMELFTQYTLLNAHHFCNDARRDGIRFAKFVRSTQGLNLDSRTELRLAEHADLKSRIKAFTLDRLPG